MKADLSAEWLTSTFEFSDIGRRLQLPPACLGNSRVGSFAQQNNVLA